MRVNVYAEEMTDRIQIISKEIEGQSFTGLRFYLELPVTREHIVHSQVPGLDTYHGGPAKSYEQIRGPFMHHPGDDDSAAVTFWGKRDLREVLREALRLLDAHYARNAPSQVSKEDAT